MLRLLVRSLILGDGFLVRLAAAATLLAAARSVRAILNCTPCSMAAIQLASCGETTLNSRTACLAPVPVTALLLFVLAPAAAAEVTMPALFSDHMLLQQNASVAVFGRAAPGEEVRVRGSWSEQEALARADSNGRWLARVDTPAAGGPHRLFIAGRNEITLEDVLIGEVWLCSGQSNMEWPLAATAPFFHGEPSYDEILREADLPEVRLFTVENAVALEPRGDCAGAWTRCTPESAAAFSAIGYFFGRALHSDLGMPIGLISADWGGTAAEAWMSRGALEAFPEFAPALVFADRLRSEPEKVEEMNRGRMAEWFVALAGEADLAAPGADDSAWKALSLPASFDDVGLADFDGIVWYRRSVDVPREQAGQDWILSLGRIDDMDTAWWNGVKVGGEETYGRHTTPREYRVPAALVRPGENSLALRVLDTGGAGGFFGEAEMLALRPAQGSGAAIPLAGAWRFSAGVRLSDLPPLPHLEGLHANTPASLYNGMIAPLVPYGLRGVIWYQGESNVGRGKPYRALFPALIADWRAHFGQGDFPFYYVQIAPFAYGGDTGEAAELREAQTLALAVPNTGMAVTMDIGDPQDIHPLNKLEVARRLALWALARTYGREGIVCSGPIYREMAVEGDAIRLWFDHAGGGLVARGGPLTHFTIRAEDGAFVPAQAVIDGDTVLVRGAGIAHPAAVRYAWGTADEPNLSNTEGLPAPSFRTDVD
ncbi:MAG: hypothetical protein HY812_21290 [Planctomycetes bacterium]|nr:hypothetical protein [Planctomycetota bacterium]